MNSEDKRMRADERDASPERWPGGEPREQAEPPITRTHTVSSSSSSVSSASSAPVQIQEIGTPVGSSRNPMSRMPTQRDEIGELERHPTALSRIQTGRSQHSHTVAASLRSRTVSRHNKTPLPNFGGGKPFPPTLPAQEDYVVEFDGPNDPLHPQNWPLKKKLPVAITLGFVTLTSAFGSSIFSAATQSVATHFGISTEVGILGVSLYVLGFATGPLIWAPLSELYGRKLPLLGSSFGFSIFSIAVAVAKDAQTVFICRFFSGFFGACPLACVGAVFADMFNNKQRGSAIAVFSMAVFSGPMLAPFIGGFIDMSYLGWRWTEYITAIMGFLGLGLSLIFLQETYPPVVLVNKASELRKRTKNWGIHAKQEEIEVDLRELMEKNLSRPMRMLFTEPIVLAISVYMAFVYGLLYLFLTFYPIVFQGIHGFNPGVGGLPFFGLIIGEIIAAGFVIMLQPGYNKKLAANNNMPVPEWRLPPVIIGGVVFGVGIFWFAWTGFKPSIHWIAPTLSGLFIGFGLMAIFLQCLNYLIDAYLMFAASAVAANTFLRSLCGAGFPLFARQMINGMGVQWAGTLLGCVALALVPVPIVFYLKGAKIRSKSNFAPTFPMASQAAHAPGSDDGGSEPDLEKQTANRTD
ncbi:MFS general substrate transporter [Polychaeton citri CBS 116435]|uniref:Cercosporin MFS transporter CTB4 n=1 Tax=Polychaeton citri CBS 116435 TaxID=1314669 RepID=A0A9P4Q8Q9_9PEZI|nr:MFS general substrate transporter [Polychaeton citri CBS 116435]